MSVDYNVYLGPYLEYVANVSWEENSLCARPEACGLSGHPYCPTCGRQAPVTRKTRTETPTIEAVRETIGLDEALSEASDIAHDISDLQVAKHRLIPNRHRFGEPNHITHIDPVSETVALSSTDWDIPAEMEWFSVAFDSEIAAVWAICDDVRIKWGLLVWQS